MAQFIELNRRFAPIDPDDASERDGFTYRISSIFSYAATWQNVLANRCTVIIAEAGVGKSEEMRHQAQKLRSEGQAAFFCPIEQVASMLVRQALEIGTAEELETWLQGSQHAYFFLDSVDEARLVQPQDFEKAIAKLVEVIEPHKERVSIVISTRPHAWRAYADRSMLTRRLGLSPVMARVLPESNESLLDGDDDETRENAGVKAQEVQVSAINIVRLLPLDQEQVSLFADRSGVTNVDAFIEAVERADADMFAMRPADLPALIDAWKKTGKIGRYAQVVADSIGLKIRELNPSHQQAAAIGLDRLMQGARALAAAVTLTQKTSILLPDKEVDPALRAQSIDPHEVLLEWSPGEVDSLLGRALFDVSLYGTVRFHHRSAREFLAAQWFQELLKQRKCRRSIEGLFFVRPYGTERWVVLPRMKAVVGWLAGVDQRIRDRLVHVDPKVLLEHGDASSLDIGTRETLLRLFAERYRGQNYTPISLDVREVRRLADPALKRTINDLLKEFRSHDDVRNLLLRIVREGQVPGCGQAALNILRDPGCANYGRSYAVEALGRAGTDKEKVDAAAYIKANASSLDEGIVASGVRSLWPAFLDDAELIHVITQVPQPKPYSGGSIQHEMDNLAESVVERGRIAFLLKSVVALLGTPPFIADLYCRVSERYAWLLPLLWKLAQRATTTSASPEADPNIIAAVAICQEAEHVQRYTGDVHKEAAALLKANVALRHAVFWHEVSKSRARSTRSITSIYDTRMSSIAFYPYDETDLKAFLGAVRDKSDPSDRLVALSALEVISRDRDRRAEILQRIETRIAGDEALESAWQVMNMPRPSTPADEESAKFYAQMERKRKTEDRRNKNARADWIAQLRADPSQVGDLTIVSTGAILRSTVALLQEVRDRAKKQSNTRWTVTQWRALEPGFGIEVAEAFRDFCQKAWRLYEPKLRSEREASNNTPWMVVIGLSGIAIEANANSDWANRLTPPEVRLATRYALQELNGFPAWFEALHQSHPKEVQEVLANEITWELAQPQAEASASYVLSRFVWTAKKLAAAMAASVLEALELNPQGNPDALTSGLSVVLRNIKDIPVSLLNVAKSVVQKPIDDKRAEIWHAFRICADAKAAIANLEAWVKASADLQIAETRLTGVLNLVWGDRDSKFGGLHHGYNTPEVLLALIRLSHATIRIEDDLDHASVHWVGPRDHAQSARNQLTELLRLIPGRATYDALIKLSSVHPLQYPRDRMLVLAEQRAEADAELELRSWTEGDISSFAAEAERIPSTQAELYALALVRLDDIKLDMEEGDESAASLFRQVKNEVELRRVLANALKHSAQGKYTTGSEEELADVTRTDIRLHNPNVEARIPIELKIGGRWRGPELRERLENQLVKQYMLEANYGVFLVVNRGAEKDLKSWTVNRRRVDFAGVINWLQQEALDVCKKHSTKVGGLSVVGIDLTLRDALAVATRDARAFSGGAGRSKARKKIVRGIKRLGVHRARSGKTRTAPKPTAKRKRL